MICESFSSAAKISPRCAERKVKRSRTSLYCSIAPTFTLPNSRIMAFHSRTGRSSSFSGCAAAYSCDIRSVISYSSHISAAMRCFSSSSFSRRVAMRKISFSSLPAVSFHSAACSSARSFSAETSFFSAASAPHSICSCSFSRASVSDSFFKSSCCSTRFAPLSSYCAACSSAALRSRASRSVSSFSRSNVSSML